MRVHYALSNRPPWGPSDDLARLDAVLCASGSIPLENLDVGAFGLEDDGNHYTQTEYRRFVTHLVHAVRDMPHPLIVSDSTIDWHNYTRDWEWTGWASSCIRDALGGRCVVDAVCGSGFIARAAQNEHFYTRVSHHLRTNRDISDVVLLGGWNDGGRTHDACSAIARLVSRVQCA